MNAFAGIRPKGGQNPTPLAFSLAFAVGVICFPVGVQPRQPPPANFYPACKSSWSTLYPTSIF